MYSKQFQTSIAKTALGSDVKRQGLCFESTVAETADGVFVDGKRTEFGSLEEARDYLKQQKLQEGIQREIQQELYEEMSDNKIASIIHRHHNNIKVTDTLIESYVELASSKLFTTDPVAQDIRRFNQLDRLVEGHLDYKLNDGTTVVISESVQEKINNLFGRHHDVVEYMRESKENFLDVVNQLEE